MYIYIYIYNMYLIFIETTHPYVAKLINVPKNDRIYTDG